MPTAERNDPYRAHNFRIEIDGLTVGAFSEVSGLVAGEATARLGMLNGMVMPIVLLPCIFTSALSMVSLPRLAKAEKNRPELKRMLLL